MDIAKALDDALMLDMHDWIVRKERARLISRINKRSQLADRRRRAGRHK